MHAEPETFTWAFGGALAGQPAPLAWTALAATAVAGVGYVVWSYRRGLVALPPAKRVVLCVLRGLFLAGLLLVLAAPTRIRRYFDDPPPMRPVAVLLDRSGSMFVPDNRHRRRVDDALRAWRELEPAAKASRHEIRTFGFGREVAERGLSADEPAKPEDTFLFAALEKVIAQAPPGGWDSIVTLTDAVDTSGATREPAIERTTSAALAKSTALDFVAAQNRYAGTPFFGLRDVHAPGHVAPETTFRLEAVFDYYEPKPRTEQVRLTVNGVAQPPSEMKLAAGRRLATWTTDVRAGAEGILDLQLRVGDERARLAVKVMRPRTNRILYYQGALDWSYRFLADVLRRDSDFSLIPVFRLPQPSAVLPAGALRQLPRIPQELGGFDVVVLANVVATQFTAEEQAGLSTWVKNGGVVLFFTPDDDSAGGFAGTELEKMLPVTFARGKGGALSVSGLLARTAGAYGPADHAKLTPFAWEDSTRVREIFADEKGRSQPLLVPRFTEFAHGAQVKPGADVLARHPTETIPGTSEHSILLAIQRYGRGHSVVLTTDALWRWKLSEPSSEHGPEIFWRTLFSWLTRQAESGLRFVSTPRVVEVGQEVELHLAGANEGLRLQVRGESRSSATEPRPSQGVEQVFGWRPPAPGLWEFLAQDGTPQEARHWITVRKRGFDGELSGAPPDEDLMRTLAIKTGGAVLDREPPASWEPVRGQTGSLLGERREQLWHRRWVFFALIGLYAGELMLRRIWRLL